MLNPDLISEFRAAVNCNDWALFEFRDKENRNKWNCICSAMDWIEVSANYLDTHPLSKIERDGSIELFAIISCIDIIIEAIEQLHRVIFSTGERVFENDDDCFADNQFRQKDREYFKNIRAWFGAHPVNLHDPEDPGNRDAKRYASWSGNYSGVEDFSVVLYSNKIGGENIFLGIKFSQLTAFARKYYNHLSTLKDELQKQYKQFCLWKRSEVFSCLGSPAERLQILLDENKKRLDNTYYRENIEELLRTFSTTITCKDNHLMVNQYLAYLLPVIDEIYENLQNMTLTELGIDPFDIPRDTVFLPNGWTYWFSKLGEARFGRGYPASYWLSEIERLFAEKFVFEFDSFQELYVLIKASLYAISTEQGELT